MRGHMAPLQFKKISLIESNVNVILTSSHNCCIVWIQSLHLYYTLAYSLGGVVGRSWRKGPQRPRPSWAALGC